jgi:homocysteine S-methyltransferase
MSGKRIVFPHATPEYFSEFAAQARALGARIIGGCCGTTPAQIAAIANAITENAAPSTPLLVRERSQATPAGEGEAPTKLQQLLEDGTFVVSVQLDPPLGANPEALMATARAVRDTGKAQFVDVNDNPRARARMSGIMASVAIERFTGVETIPHLTPRDMTVAGLESILLGSHAEGVRNILAVTGDPPESGDYPGTHAVYDVDSIGLVDLMARLNRGEDYHGRAIDAPTSFFPGVAVNPTAADLGLEVERFHQKVAAGARYAMTQLLFDLESLDAFRQRIGGTWPIPVLVGVWPIRTYETLVRMHNEMPGLVVPERVLERYRAAGPAARDVGLALGHELIEGARAVAQGVYVMAPFKQPMNVVELLPELQPVQLPVETGS